MFIISPQVDQESSTKNPIPRWVLPEPWSLSSGEARTRDRTCVRGPGARHGVGSVSAGRPDAKRSPGAADAGRLLTPRGGILKLLWTLCGYDLIMIWIWPGYDLIVRWLWSDCDMVVTLLLLWRTRRTNRSKPLHRSGRVRLRSVVSDGSLFRSKSKG